MKKFIVTILSLLLFECSQLAGTSDETSTGTRSTRVLNPDLTPAVGAKVELFSAGDTSRIPVASGSTDEKGECAFKVEKGYYNIWAEDEDDSLTAYRDSVFFNPIPEDSSSLILNKTGSISGYIRMQPGDNPSEVYVGALGTFKYCNVDDQGHFILSGLAQGEYTLRLVDTKNSEYTPTFVTVDCIADSAVVLKDTINLVYSGIPAVYGITAQFDSITGVAKITWNRSSYVYLDRYIVYRRQSDATYNENEQIGMTSDTSFLDTLTGFLEAGGGLRYSVAILSQTGRSGNAYVSTDVKVCVPESLLQMISPANGSSVDAGGSINLAWAKVPGADSYQVQLATDISFSDTVKLITQSDTQVTVSSLSNSTYYWRIRAKNGNNQYGPWSSPGAFGVGVFTEKLGALNEYGGNLKMACTENGAVILNVHLDNTAQIVQIDSTGRRLWQRSITSDKTSDYFYTHSINIMNDGFLAVLEINADSSLIIKYNLTGMELWRKKMKRIESVKFVEQSGNIVLATGDKVSILNPNGISIDEFAQDSLLLAIPITDTSMILVSGQYYGIRIKELSTTSGNTHFLDSIYLATTYSGFNGWKQNDGSVMLALTLCALPSSTQFMHITPDGENSLINYVNGEIISISEKNRNVVILSHYFMIENGGSTINYYPLHLFDESMKNETNFQLYDDQLIKHDKNVFINGCGIQGNSNALAIMHISKSDGSEDQAYLLRFPINVKPLLPPELY